MGPRERGLEKGLNVINEIPLEKLTTSLYVWFPIRGINVKVVMYQ